MLLCSEHERKETETFAPSSSPGLDSVPDVFLARVPGVLSSQCDKDVTRAALGTSLPCFRSPRGKLNIGFTRHQSTCCQYSTHFDVVKTRLHPEPVGKKVNLAQVHEISAGRKKVGGKTEFIWVKTIKLACVDPCRCSSRGIFYLWGQTAQILRGGRPEHLQKKHG